MLSLEKRIVGSEHACNGGTQSANSDNSIHIPHGNYNQGRFLSLQRLFKCLFLIHTFQDYGIFKRFG